MSSSIPGLASGGGAPRLRRPCFFNLLGSTTIPFLPNQFSRCGVHQGLYYGLGKHLELRVANLGYRSALVLDLSVSRALRHIARCNSIAGLRDITAGCVGFCVSADPAQDEEQTLNGNTCS